MDSLSDRLKKSRISVGLNQTELGKIIGVGKTTISMYETGNSTPSDEIKLKIAEYFNVSVDYLLGKTDIKNH
ncbi:DNA-binding XRE family transcriptional regulator [Kineothrix alysoides]|uniref:DNA-binding XRE family transcriptional regulator n=1 Tax=Kineothrix alysoides TaxID=1469948 RepID=A0A4R1QRK6_9FIRM